MSWIKDNPGKTSIGLAVAAFLANDEGYPKTAIILAGCAVAVLIFPQGVQGSALAPTSSPRPQVRP